MNTFMLITILGGGAAIVTSLVLIPAMMRRSPSSPWTFPLTLMVTLAIFGFSSVVAWHVDPPRPVRACFHDGGHHQP